MKNQNISSFPPFWPALNLVTCGLNKSRILIGRKLPNTLRCRFLFLGGRTAFFFADSLFWIKMNPNKRPKLNVTKTDSFFHKKTEKKRLQKELLALQNDPPPGMTLNEKSVENTITQWVIDMEGASGTLYEGEKFQLLFKFSSRYPFDSPQVMFTGENIPVHPHIYSNGHICLSILTEDWSPALSVQSVCLSIISMLSSCKEKRRPPDNSFYVRTCNKNPKKTKWWYHDDTC
ncbi:probable ubiquitin-conjugating enzyme E2 W-B isoform X1 [Neoarius graeffei]|nr:probable ubiquitin-conjugating enzyme E2 W-B isoform X1 [Neoarius graeffei]